MFHYKKPAVWVSAGVVVILAVVSLALLIGKPEEKTAESLPEENTVTGSISEAVNTPQTSYNKVTIEFLSEFKGFKTADTVKITDYDTVARIDNEIRYSMAHSDKTSLKNNHTDEYTIKLSNEVGGYSAGLFYDTLYDKAYIVRDGSLFETETDFARYIDSLLENTSLSYLAEGNEAAALFKSYGWTLDYQIGTVKSKLIDINGLSAFTPNAYYFAYNNELSKDIGLDMSDDANNSDIDVDIYRIYESMPKEFHPIQNCRGIVVRSGGKIIGAFISAGRHSAFSACSLTGRRFETVTGQMLERWLADRIYADATEEGLSQMGPEQVIKAYFAALDKKDAKAAAYCVSRMIMMGNLTTNMPSNELFNPVIGLPLTDPVIGSQSSFDNLKSAALSDIRLISEPDDNERVFAVTVRLEYVQSVSVGSGEQGWDCYMIYESPQTGWKIKGFGHG